MLKPITAEVSRTIQKKTHQLKIKQLNELLKQNRKVQQELKRTRGIIAERMNCIDQYISTFRLKKQCPRSTALLSLLNFEKNVPEAIKEQYKIISKEEGKNGEEYDGDEQHTPQKNKKGRKNAKNKDQQICKSHNRSLNKSLDFSLLPSDPTQINFIETAKITEFTLPIDLYKEWYDHNKKKEIKAPFTQEEERKILKAHQKYSVTWQKICQIIDWRPFQELYYQFQNRLNPKITLGRWNIRQSLMLLILLEHYGAGKWALISQKIVIKSQLQVRERYCNVLDPNLGKDNYWTREMENKLMQVAGQYDYRWNEISKISIFKNKTDNCIWRKFRSIMIKKSKQEIVDHLSQHNSRGLIEKLFKYKDQYDKRTRKFTQITIHTVFDPNSRARQLRQSRENFMSNAQEIKNIPFVHNLMEEPFIPYDPVKNQNQFRYFQG